MFRTEIVGLRALHQDRWKAGVAPGVILRFITFTKRIKMKQILKIGKPKCSPWNNICNCIYVHCCRWLIYRSFLSNNSRQHLRNELKFLIYHSGIFWSTSSLMPSHSPVYEIKENFILSAGPVQLTLLNVNMGDVNTSPYLNTSFRI